MSIPGRQSNLKAAAKARLRPESSSDVHSPSERRPNRTQSSSSGLHALKARSATAKEATGGTRDPHKTESTPRLPTGQQETRLNRGGRLNKCSEGNKDPIFKSRTDHLILSGFGQKTDSEGEFARSEEIRERPSP